MIYFGHIYMLCPWNFEEEEVNMQR